MNAPVFFFTAEDPRELPKGSRDPLRFLPEWTAVARKMIPYLTTVTPSYRGFLTRFLFHGMLEDISPALVNAPATDQWSVFCKFEQLCALVRTQLDPKTPNLPGISGVGNRLQGGVITVGSETPYWLVRSQRTTGYWGYYHQACLGSRLIKNNKASSPGYQLTEVGLAQYKSSQARTTLIECADVLAKMVKEKSLKIDIDQFIPLATLFAQQPLAGSESWGRFWTEHLLVPEPDVGKSYSRPILVEFAREVKAVWGQVSSPSPGQVWERLAISSSEHVASFAAKVMAYEAVIGLCEWVFDVCRMKFEEGGSLHEAASWAYSNGYNEDWLGRLRRLQAPASDELAYYRAEALRKADSFEALAKLLLERHKRVMASRKGVPWVELLDGDILMVRDPSDEPSLPDFEKSPFGIRWRYDYFLDSWLRAGVEIGFLPEASNG